MNQLEYAEYLQSPEWEQSRNLKYLCDGVKDKLGRFRCEECLLYFHRCRLEVHHITYERIGLERPEDLRIVCESCHGQQHGEPELPWHKQEIRKRDQ